MLHDQFQRDRTKPHADFSVSDVQLFPTLGGRPRRRTHHRTDDQLLPRLR
ncbi:hypothetical protein KPATCC21470_6724 [Kitasatospora purpeofusca]